MNVTATRCHHYILITALTGVCQLAHGDRPWHYFGVVTNILDVTHVTFEGERIGFGGDFRSRTAPLAGIAAPEKGSPEEKTLLAILEKTLLGKRVNVCDWIDGGESRYASIYVTNDPQHFAPKDNVNLMLIKGRGSRGSAEDATHTK